MLTFLLICKMHHIAIIISGHFLPGHVGIPMGGTLGPKYYMLEIHYDNPSALRSK